jgi:hypothetical protein
MSIDGDPRVAVARDGAATLTGLTLSANFPMTPKAFDTTRGGSGDAFVSRFDPTGSRLMYSTYIGGTDAAYEVGLAIATAGPGRVAVVGIRARQTFP